MDTKALTIGDLADASGASRRAIRFYVQRGLLPPPEGKGRGSIYGLQHLKRLKHIQSLQAAGHSLAAIAKLVEQGDPTATAEMTAGSASKQARPMGQSGRQAARSDDRLSVQLWTRLRLEDGIEIHVDATRHALPVEKLTALRDAVREILKER